RRQSLTRQVHRPLYPYHYILSSFLFTATPTTEIHTLSLHDALPISASRRPLAGSCRSAPETSRAPRCGTRRAGPSAPFRAGGCRSEEHTSELQSRSDLVCRLLLEKKKDTKPPSLL